MAELPAYLTGILGILLFTSFVKVLTTLSIMRAGVGLHGGGFGLVVVVASFGLSLLLMAPQLGSSASLEILSWTPQKIESQFRPFMQKHADPELLERFSGSAEQSGNEQGAAVKQASFGVLVGSFLISELKEAFELGLLILIPFLVIDLAVVNGLVALGITQMSYAVVALPLKLLLFLAVDGWALITEKLISGYAGG